MSRYQYRLKVNDREEIFDNYEKISDMWSRLCKTAESRGGVSGSLSRRLITTPCIFKLLGHSDGWVILDQNTAVGPWEILAECDGRQ
ncbi:MAG: hypothetical protein A4E61_00248 [Syntrophorhabdus sp. PtaB.Bin184]|nr:MAG: hypothetical protein A4E61_00248 [Syntrophorhabdus sp. PtaB.Bin184]